MLHLETIEPKALELLRKLQTLPVFERTRLVGGASLALQLGHRKSEDLDLFGVINAKPEEILSECYKVSKPDLTRISPKIKSFRLDGVKVDCINYPHTWIDECKEVEGIRLASICEIAAMKINALIRRGTKNDFVDLYYILNELSLPEILDLYEKKYPDIPCSTALKYLTYFERAESNPMPQMLFDITWEEIKFSIFSEVINTNYR